LRSTVYDPHPLFVSFVKAALENSAVSTGTHAEKNSV